MDLHLKGKTALITGGSKGIGRACATILASEGCNIHIAARDEDELKTTANAIESEYRVQVTIHSTDLSRGENAIGLSRACPGIDILVNNAGAIPRGDLWQVNEAEWRESWDLKLFGYINLCRAVYAGMRSRRKGVIINVIGSAGERPRNDYIAGGTANAALMAFTKSLGAKSLDDGIRVIGVNPGLIMTERLENILKSVAKAKFSDAERWTELIPQNPLPGEPDDIAKLVVFLASDCAKFITGTVVTADGGYAAG